MTTTMFAMTQDTLGGPEVLHGAEVPRPTPGVGEVLVQVRAAGINPADHMYRQTGAFGARPPFTLGWDVSGVVSAVGPGVTVLDPGDEVFGLLPFPTGAGAYAEYVVAPTRALVRKPETLSHTEAGALPLAGLTAWQSLVETAHVGEGTRVLVTGATGGVGHLAIQIAAARGADVAALASTANVDAAKGYGASRVVDYRTTDVSTALSDLDVVIDVLGGDFTRTAVDLVRPGGTVVTMIPQIAPATTGAAAERGVRLRGLLVEADRLGLGELVRLVEAGRLRPTVSHAYPLADAATAHREAGSFGKSVLLP
jgi:NADPH:quinone reductase-like Zn-dependent oxidoreductase